MFNWIVGSIAILLWIAATLLYLRRPIAQMLADRRKQREVAAKIREQQAKGPPA